MKHKNYATSSSSSSNGCKSMYSHRENYKMNWKENRMWRYHSPNHPSLDGFPLRSLCQEEDAREEESQLLKRLFLGFLFEVSALLRVVHHSSTHVTSQRWLIHVRPCRQKLRNEVPRPQTRAHTVTDCQESNQEQPAGGPAGTLGFGRGEG